MKDNKINLLSDPKIKVKHFKNYFKKLLYNIKTITTYLTIKIIIIRDNVKLGFTKLS